MKRVTLVMEDELHKCAKIKSIEDDKNFMQYIIDLIKKDLETKKEQTQ